MHNSSDISDHVQMFASASRGCLSLVAIVVCRKFVEKCASHTPKLRSCLGCRRLTGVGSSDARRANLCRRTNPRAHQLQLGSGAIGSVGAAGRNPPAIVNDCCVRARRGPSTRRRGSDRPGGPAVEGCFRFCSTPGCASVRRYRSSAHGSGRSPASSSFRTRRTAARATWRSRIVPTPACWTSPTGSRRTARYSGSRLGSPRTGVEMRFVSRRNARISGSTISDMKPCPDVGARCRPQDAYAAERPQDRGGADEVLESDSGGAEVETVSG